MPFLLHNCAAQPIRCHVSRRGLFLAAVVGLTATTAESADRLTEGTSLVFASVHQGRAVLSKRDDYVSRLSPIDRSARLKTDTAVSEQEYLAFVGRQVVPWLASERSKVLEVADGLRKKLDSLQLPLPPQVVMIKTSGREEGGAAYTRANAIVLTESHLRRDVEGLTKLICHELFHIMSRSAPTVRDGLYATIGFHRCQEPQLPASLTSIKLTNPDAPANQHCINVTIDGRPRTVVPILISETRQYDVDRGGEFFEYLLLRFVAIEIDQKTGRSSPVMERNQPLIVPVTQLSGFFEQVGHNTGYIIHPEEILADNFVHLVTEEKKLESPRIVSGMSEFFAQMRVLPN